MRELERDDLPSPLSAAPLIVVGRGRLGRSLAAAADRAGIEVTLVSHDDVGSVPEGAGVLLCVPDSAIAETAERFAAADPSLIGHVSGATTLDALAPAGARGAG
ncbi:MAG TPA: DUF2520 domain-containing protein, partial [Solirubrobacterales bacterium]|nr:DUF2520 domain-containing protein [Solirubrobacterales bacterium]